MKDLFLIELRKRCERTNVTESELSFFATVCNDVLEKRKKLLLDNTNESARSFAHKKWGDFIEKDEEQTAEECFLIGAKWATQNL